jgi:hypothetical protein
MNRQATEGKVRGPEHLLWLRAFLPALVLSVGACTAMQPPDASGPRANQPNYPVLVNEDSQRREAALVAATQMLAQAGADKNAVKLQPVTATVQSLNTDAKASIFLPKIGAADVMTDEEVRESLRRFIVSWQTIVGADPPQLSLVDQLNQPDGTKLASYEQRPFRYPLRGDYGNFRIQFANDGRVLSLSSTCIPNADRLQSTLAAVTPVLKPEDAIQYIRDNGVTYTDRSGQQQSVRPSANASIDAGELVFYALPAGISSIELHLAWEVQLKNAPVKKVYLDAVKAQVLAVG